MRARRNVLVTFVGTLLLSGFSIYPKNSYSLYTVHLSSNEMEKEAQIRSLQNTYDILGINHQAHSLDVLVKRNQMDSFAKLQLSSEVKFDPQNALPQNISSYLDPTEVAQTLQDLAAQFPNQTRLFEAGKTHENRTIWGIEISNHLQDPLLPVALFNGMHHARELMTTEVLVHMATTLLTTQNTDPKVGEWLEKTRIVVVPQLNPDGNARVHAGTRMWRKNTWKEKDSVVGVDLNRNYPAFWNHCNGSSGMKFSDTYRGPRPGSEPESQALMRLVSELKPVVDISYHSYSELIIYPFGCRKEKNPSADLFAQIGQFMNQQLPNDQGKVGQYKVGAAPDVIYEADGTDLDWQWRTHGVLGYTIEINSSGLGFQPDYAKWRDVTVKRQEGGWRALLQRVHQQSVQAQLGEGWQSQVSHYTIEKRNESGLYESFAPDLPAQTFTPKGSTGFIYNLLQPGSYRFQFFGPGISRSKSVTFAVTEEVTRLGTIEI